jgi:hypothetical protein
VEGCETVTLFGNHPVRINKSNRGIKNNTLHFLGDMGEKLGNML